MADAEHQRDSDDDGTGRVDDWTGRVNAIVDSVRTDVAGRHSLADLAERAHASPHHFHRRFRQLTGETPARFVTRSRVERAAYLIMAQPDRALTDIGLDVGFTDQSDFSRSFRRVYGVAPSKWDHRGGTPPRAEPGGEQEVRIVTRPAMRLAVVGIRGIFGIDDLTGGYETLLRWMDGRGLDPDRSSLVGASFDNYRTTPAERVHYSFGFIVGADVEASGAVHIRELPAFSAAAVTIDGGLGEIAAAWDELYDRWFPNRPWSPVGLPGFKLFRRRPDEIGWERFDLDCAIAFRVDGEQDIRRRRATPPPVPSGP